MEFLESYDAISQRDLEKVEGEVGYQLPQEYKLFLLKHNGGRPILDGVRHENEHFDYVGYFYAIRGEMYHDDLARQIIEHKDMIPEGYLPIGESPGGDVFCISLKEPTKGAVFHWDHEQANYDGEPWEYNMTKLASSLTEFLEGLCAGE
jgi:hypothetical protein